VAVVSLIALSKQTTLVLATFLLGFQDTETNLTGFRNQEIFFVVLTFLKSLPGFKE
jgi:hypothetical protein